MNARIATTIGLGAAALCGLGLIGCDDVRYESAPPDAQPGGFQSNALHALVADRGLEALYGVEHADGAPLDYETRSLQLFDLEVTLGPLSERIAIDRWDVESSNDDLKIDLETNNITTAISARIGRGASARICRYSVEIDRIEATTDAAIASQQTPPTIEPNGEADIEIEHPTVTRLSPCEPLEEVASENPSDVEQMFVDYLQSGLVEMVGEAVAFSPVEAVGLVYEPVRLRRIANFENRRGMLDLAGRIEQQDDVRFDGGLRLDVDAAVNGNRAGCAPPLGLDGPEPNQAGSVPSTLLERAGADVGIALATPLLARITQVGALSGFACRGLEDVDLDGAQSNLATDDLRLEEVGLDALEIGSWVEPVLTPAATPRLRTDAIDDVLEMDWPELTLELYGRMQNVPVRFAELTVDFDVELRPVERSDMLVLAFDSTDVKDAVLESPWLDEAPLQTELVPWTQRLMLLILEDAFEVPLPLAPQTPLHLVDSQVRNDDLVFLFEFDGQK